MVLILGNRIICFQQTFDGSQIFILPKKISLFDFKLQRCPHHLPIVKVATNQASSGKSQWKRKQLFRPSHRLQTLWKCCWTIAEGWTSKRPKPLQKWDSTPRKDRSNSTIWSPVLKEARHMKVLLKNWCVTIQINNESLTNNIISLFNF